MNIPHDLKVILDEAWQATQSIPGHLQENEARFLGLLAACTPASGAIVEIGSFKGRSTVMLAKVAAHYGLGPVVAIDPHNSSILLGTGGNAQVSSYPDFVNSLRTSGITEHVESHVAYSAEVAKSWNRPIRVLWIDGDHTLEGAKTDLEEFLPYVVPFGVVAFHDALNAFPGPIRVFVEQVLRSSKFGAAGFVHSIAWAQFRPIDGHRFEQQRRSLERRASRLMPFVEKGEDLRGMRKRLYKLNRYRVPHAAIAPSDWAALVEGQSLNHG